MIDELRPKLKNNVRIVKSVKACELLSEHIPTKITKKQLDDMNFCVEL